MSEGSKSAGRRQGLSRDGSSPTFSSEHSQKQITFFRPSTSQSTAERRRWLRRKEDDRPLLHAPKTTVESTPTTIRSISCYKLYYYRFTLISIDSYESNALIFYVFGYLRCFAIVIVIPLLSWMEFIGLIFNISYLG